MKLEAWQGLSPTVEEQRDGFVIGSVAVKLGPWRGVWDRRGKLIVREEDALVLEFVPGRDEVALVRTALPSKPKKKYGWFFERWSLAGKRLSRVDCKAASLGGAEPVSLEFPKKHAGEVAKIRVADQTRPYSFFVRDRVAPIGVFLTVAELEGAPVPPERRIFQEDTTAEELAELARRSDDLAARVAQRADLPARLLEALSKHPSATVRAKVAGAFRLPEAIIRRLANDADVGVRLEIVGRIDRLDLKTKQMVPRRAPADVLRALTEDPDPKVRKRAWSHVGDVLDDSDLGEQPLEARLAAVRWGMPIELERRLARDPSVKVRFKLADSRHPRKCGRKPNIDGKALALLKKDTSEKVREAAAFLTPYPAGTKRPPP